LIADLIFKGDVGGMKAVMTKSRELGMQTFDQALFDFYEAGKISLEEALRNADAVNELRLRIKLESKVKEDKVSGGLDQLSLVSDEDKDEGIEVV
jgi:twitching motility protein PilU